MFIPRFTARLKAMPTPSAHQSEKYQYLLTMQHHKVIKINLNGEKGYLSKFTV